MSAKYIPLTIENEYIKGANVVIGAAGSHNDVYLSITFGDMWADTIKRIVWLDANKANPTITYLTPAMLYDGVYQVPVPATPKAIPGKMTMTVKGSTVSDDEELTATLTAAAQFTVLESAWSDDAQEQEAIDPTIAEQLQAEIDGKQDILTFDDVPTYGSTNPVTSTGIYVALSEEYSVQYAASEIEAGELSVSVPYQGLFVDAYSAIDGERVLTEQTITDSLVTFTIAETIGDDIECTVLYVPGHQE